MQSAAITSNYQRNNVLFSDWNQFWSRVCIYAPPAHLHRSYRNQHLSPIIARHHFPIFSLLLQAPCTIIESRFPRKLKFCLVLPTIRRLKWKSNEFVLNGFWLKINCRRWAIALIKIRSSKFQRATDEKYLIPKLMMLSSWITRFRLGSRVRFIDRNEFYDY